MRPSPNTRAVGSAKISLPRVPRSRCANTFDPAGKAVRNRSSMLVPRK